MLVLCLAVIVTADLSYVKLNFSQLFVYDILMLLFLRAGVQPTLDPYTAAFLWQTHCVNPGGEESG